MSWPRGSFVAALIALSIPLAHADIITVNTVTDDYANNSLCSLREAVEYFNQGKTPATGFQGCVATTSSTASINLPGSSSPYLITGSAITIQQTLEINGAGTLGVDGERSLIKVQGNHRAFVVSTSRVWLPPACAATTNCSPGNAPPLVAASDSDAPDNLTSFLTPSFTVSVPSPAPPAGQYYLIRLYGKDNQGTEQIIGSGEGTGVGPLDILSILRMGEYYVSYSVQLYKTADNTPVDPAESPRSAATTLRGYLPDAKITVTLSGVDIQGCASAAGCADNVDGTGAPIVLSNGLEYRYGQINTANNGGIIYSDQSLYLSTTLLHDGYAGKGGAIYIGPAGALNAGTTEFKNNSANNGAAVFIEQMALDAIRIKQSLFTANTASVGATLEVGAARTGGNVADGSILGSTFSGNTGKALSLRSDMTLNGDTIVLNKGGGIDFNGGTGVVYNTILAVNSLNETDTSGVADCSNTGTVTFQRNLLLTGAGCTGVAADFISNSGNQLLMGKINPQGQCTGDNSGNGLLCPLADNGGTTRSHLPRLLSSYTAATDSPVIDKGIATGTGQCITPDQRGKSRNAACDVGAVETQPAAGAYPSGGDIRYGQSYVESLQVHLGDDELLRDCPASPPVPPNEVAYQYARTVPGCPWVSVLPGRGKVVFNSDGTYTYTPTVDFHGRDNYAIRVMSVRSSLNPDTPGKSILLSAKVDDAPTHGISSDSIGGSFDAFGLLVMSGLLLRLRSRPEAK